MTDKPDEVDVRVTDFEANLDILSERTKEMCSDVKVFWMEIRKGMCTYIKECFYFYESRLIRNYMYIVNTFGSESENVEINVDY